MMLVCALNFSIVILCVDHVTWLTKVAMSNLSGWLCWNDGCRLWLCIKYILYIIKVVCKDVCISCMMLCTLDCY